MFSTEERRRPCELSARERARLIRILEEMVMAAAIESVLRTESEFHDDMVEE